jgi:hypothetical protein
MIENLETIDEIFGVSMQHHKNNGGKVSHDKRTFANNLIPKQQKNR